MMKVNKRVYLSSLYFLFLVANPILFSGGLVYYLLYHAGDLLDMGLSIWMIAFVGSIVSMAFALTPTTFIALLSGYLLHANAVLLVVPSYLAASLLGFYVARRVDQGSIIEYVSNREKVAVFLQRLKRREFMFVILSRLSPVLPFAMMNFVLSAMQVRLRTYMVAGFLGMLPRTILFIWVGSMARDLHEAMEYSRESVWTKVFVIVLVVLSVTGFIYIIARSLQKDTGSE